MSHDSLTGRERRLALGLVCLSRAQIQDRATPELRATSATGRFSAVTAVMTRRAFDIPGASGPDVPYARRHAAVDVLYVLTDPVLDVLKPDTTPATTSTYSL